MVHAVCQLIQSGCQTISQSLGATREVRPRYTSVYGLPPYVCMYVGKYVCMYVCTHTRFPHVDKPTRAEEETPPAPGVIQAHTLFLPHLSVCRQACLLMCPCMYVCRSACRV